MPVTRRAAPISKPLVDESRFLVWELPARIIAYRKHVKNLPTPHALQIEFHRMAVK